MDIPENIADARRQGQFEGQVLAKLDDLKSTVTLLGNNYNGLEIRVRSLEQTKSSYRGGINVIHVIILIASNLVAATLSGFLVYLLTHHAI